MDIRSNFYSARLLLKGRSTQAVRGLLSPSDRIDWYQFQLRRAGQLDLRLSGLRASASVTLFDRSQQIVGQSRRSRQAAAISRTLEAGTFWIRVAGSPGSRTGYQLRLAIAEARNQPQTVSTGADSAALPAVLLVEAIAAPVPASQNQSVAPAVPASSAPVSALAVPPAVNLEAELPSSPSFSIAAEPLEIPAPTVSLNRNQGINTIRGNSLRITDSLLQASSSQQSDARQLVYTLTRLPENSVLELNGRSLGLGDRFTQQDVFNGGLALRSIAQDTGLTELFRSSTSLSLLARGISDTSVAFAVEEYDPERDAIDVDLFLHDGSTVTQIADNLLTQPGNFPGISDSIAVQGIAGSTVLFSVPSSDTLETLYLYNGSTLQTLADNFASAQGLFAGEKLVGSRAIWTDQQFRWLGNRSAPDDRIYATDIATGTTARLAGESQFDQFIGFTNGGWVWTGTGGADGGTDRELFYYDDRTQQTRQITQNSVNERDVRIGGETIAWQTDQSSAILFYSGSTSRLIPAPPGNRNGIVAVSDTQIIWSTATSQTAIEYYAYEIATGRSTRLDNGTAQFGSGLIAGNHIFWQEARPNGEVFFYSGTAQQSRPLTDQRTNSDRLLSVTDRGAFITSGDGENRQLYFFDLESETLTQLTAPSRLNLRINDGSNLGLGGSSPNPSLATWISRNPESFSVFNSSTLLYQLDQRSTVQLSSDASPTHIVGNQVAFQATELIADRQAGSPPLQEQVLYLYRAAAVSPSPVQDSFGFSLTDGVGGAIESRFAVQID